MRTVVTFFVFLGILLGGFSTPVYAQELPAAEKARLEAELKKYEAEIADLEKQLKAQRAKSGTIQGDVNVLATKIAKAKKEIQARTTAIGKLAKEINEKDKTINTLSAKIVREHESLGQLIRKTRELDDTSFVALLLSNENLSDFYSDVDSFAEVKEAIQGSVDRIRVVKKETEIEKTELDKKHDEEINTKASLEAARREVERSEAEKKKLLAASKNQEKTYSTIKAEKEAKASAIRTALFGLRDAGPIQFGQAFEYAKQAQKVTGVRPAFLLAIITQESALGKNVGSCYMTNSDTAAGVRIASGAPLAGIMKPGRDVAPFLEITKSLGLDYKTTRVSCPLSYGYGGGMGPAQFIPSTWMIMKSKIASALGVSTPNPWNPQHAFMASALYLKDLGAGGGVYANERNAACKYYSGRSCAGNTNGTTYGNQVMAKAVNIQENMINVLDNN